MESTASLNASAASSPSSSAMKSSNTLAKTKKTLVQCKACLGSSWVHGNEPAPFAASSSSSSTAAAASSSATFPSQSSLGLAPVKEGFSFSPKPHCLTQCSKCKACTNGKQLVSQGVGGVGGVGVGVFAGSSTASLSTKDKETPSHTGLVKKRPTTTTTTTTTTDTDAPAMDVVTFATLDTPAAVAAVSISRIAHAAKPLRIANGDDGGDADADADADSDSGDSDDNCDAARAAAKRSANIKRRVHIMGSSDNLAPLGKKTSCASLDTLSLASNTGAAPRKPLSTQNSSASSSKDTVAVNSAGNSLSSIASQQHQQQQQQYKKDASIATPAIVASSVSQSHVSLVSDFYGGGADIHHTAHQHPAVNILSMGSGILTRKRDTFIAAAAASNNNSTDAIAREFSTSFGLSNGGGGGMTPSPSIVASSSLSAGLPFVSGSNSSSASKSLSTASASASATGGGAGGGGGILGDSSSLLGDSYADREEFPDLIDLGTMFGSKVHPEATKTRMIWSARLYEVCRKEYLSRPFDEEVFPERPPNDEIKYRILENFDEGRLDTVTYATRATGSEFISSGDIESLVDALIFPLNQDNSYTEVFLASYRFFMPASELLTSLIEWYNVELDPATATPQQEQYFKLKKRQFRGRAAKVLLTWIKNHWHDFHVDKDLLDELSEFVGDLGEVCFGDGQRMTQAIREQRLSWYMTQYIPPFSAKRAPAAESAKPWGLLWEPEAFAAQLTLIDHHYFRQIRPDTYLSLLQKRVPKGTLAGDAAVKVLMDYVSWFRLVSSYTATLIYKEDTTKKRTKAIKRFIKVAKECRLLNNFNTMFAVMHGLKRNLVARMSGAWDGLSGKHVEAFREMEALMDPKGGFANFWGELKNCVAPLIPFFAAYIHDLLEIHETEPVFTRDLNKTQEQQQSGYRMVTTDDDDDNDPEIINFSKFYNLYSIVAEIEVWRSYSYNSVIPEAAAAANDPKGDTCAVVLNHMRDWKVVEDSLLDL